LSSSPEFRKSLRRLKPDKHHRQLAHRERSQLQLLGDLKPPYPKLLLDTTVYIDALQGSLPDQVEVVLRAASLWHCTVTEAELSAAAGLLDPRHAETDRAVQRIADSVELRPAHRILNPDREAWRDAGILSGLLARLQQYRSGERRKALNDALIYRTAVKNGCAVLTRNVLDFDLIMQLDPTGQSFFYDRI
jgi:predicted nucleic acid-binding protein